MEYKNNIVYIADTLSEAAVACQLAEECSELAKAALKLYRCVTDENPTPMKREEIIKSITEEFADVECAFNVLSSKVHIRYGDVLKNYDKKMARWALRMKGLRKNETEKD